MMSRCRYPVVGGFVIAVYAHGAWHDVLTVSDDHAAPVVALSFSGTTTSSISASVSLNGQLNYITGDEIMMPPRERRARWLTLAVASPRPSDTERGSS